MLPEFVRRIAACAPKAQVKVACGASEAYVIPDVPSPLEEHVVQVAAASAEDVKALRDAIERFGDTITSATTVESDLSETVKQIVAAQETILSSVGKIAETLALPVRPVYDAKGKLIEARRTIPGG